MAAVVISRGFAGSLLFKERLGEMIKKKLKMLIFAFLTLAIIIPLSATVKGVSITNVKWCGTKSGGGLEDCKTLDNGWFEDMLGKFGSIDNGGNGVMGTCWTITFPGQYTTNQTMENGNDIDSGHTKVLIFECRLENDWTGQQYQVSGLENQGINYRVCIPPQNVLQVAAAWWGLDSEVYDGGQRTVPAIVGGAVEQEKNYILSVPLVTTFLASAGTINNFIDPLYPNGPFPYEIYVPGSAIISAQFTAGLDLYPGVHKKLAVALTLGGTFFVGARAGENTDFYISNKQSQPLISAVFGTLPDNVTVNSFADLVTLMHNNYAAYAAYFKNAVDVTNKVIPLINYAPTHVMVDPDAGNAAFGAGQYDTVNINMGINVPTNSMNDAFFGTNTGGGSNKLLVITIAIPGGLNTRIVGSSKSGINWSFVEPCIAKSN
jgi:hypothetical protein